MHCLKPRTVSHDHVIPCGNCRFCRRRAQQVWGTRLLLESYFYPRSVFGTLTYDDDHVPRDADGVEQLHKPDITRFIEKFRYRTKHIRPPRYFIVGEYGDKTWRPHYHYIFFGHGVEIEQIVAASWTDEDDQPIGFHQIAELNFDRALYTARYCTKKLTRAEDERLKGRMPEFQRCSTKPGIGTPAIGWLADAISRGIRGKTENPEDLDYGPSLRLIGDVFNTVRIEGRLMPLGLYMRQKLREALGLSNDSRERAIQLGRFDQNGEILEQEIPSDWSPVADLSDINSPWRRYAEKKASEAKAKIAQARSDKEQRQEHLFGGDRI